MRISDSNDRCDMQKDVNDGKIIRSARKSLR